MSQVRPQASDPEARESILKAIDAADAPVSAAALASLSGLRAATRVQSLLTDDIAAQHFFDWGQKRYWRQDPRAFARQRLLDLAAREFLARSQLTSRAAKESPLMSLAIVRSVVKKLLSEKEFREMTKPGAKTKGILSVKSPEAFLEFKIAWILKSYGIERPSESIRTLLATTQPIKSSPEAEPSQNVHDVAEVLFSAVNRLAFAPGTTVTFHVLRQQPDLARIPKRIFDQAALWLQDERRALLNSHGYAGSIPTQEQDQLVTDGFGNYYVSIYAR